MMADLGACLVWQLLVMIMVSARAHARVVDLTHKLDADSMTWPLNPKFNFTILHRGLYPPTENWLENNHISLAEHTGSHIDAPAHLGIEGQMRVDDIPLENLMGPGVVIDIKEKVKENPDYTVSIDDLMTWEKKHGNIAKGSIILMNSGWMDKYIANDAATILGKTGTDMMDVSDLHFPGYSAEAVQWLLKYRDINAIGADTPAFDSGQSRNFPVHRLLSINQKVGIENVAYLDNLPEAGSTVFLPVIKIREGSGGPARLFALVGDSNGTCRTMDMTLQLKCVCFLLWTYLFINGL